MEFKGTKGEWKASIIDVDNCGVYENDIENEYHKVVATTWGLTQEEAKYNAKLIAAAPELLEALHLSNEWLKKIAPAYKGTEYFEILEYGIEKNEKAIKKALE